MTGMETLYVYFNNMVYRAVICLAQEALQEIFILNISDDLSEKSASIWQIANNGFLSL